MSSYLEKLRAQIEERLSMPVRFTKDPTFGMFTANVSNPADLSAYQSAVSDLPVERVVFVPPVFLNFYLTAGWQQEAVRQILLGASDGLSAHRFDDFEVQYVYNRICNQLELLASLGYVVPTVEDSRLELLKSPTELALMEQLAREPNLALIAAQFHIFFNSCPIRGEAADIAGARLALVQACRKVFELF